jgi:hypothetical protein
VYAAELNVNACKLFEELRETFVAAIGNVPVPTGPVVDPNPEPLNVKEGVPPTLVREVTFAAMKLPAERLKTSLSAARVISPSATWIVNVPRFAGR